MNMFLKKWTNFIWKTVTMLMQKWGPLSIFMFTTVFLNYVHGQCKIVPGGKTFPDPKILYRDATEYEMRVEVNDLLKMSSMYVTEYFDVEDHKGRVDSHFAAIKKTFLYKDKTKEAFIFGNSLDCQSNFIDKITPPHEGFIVYDWRYQDPFVQFGPFAMLLKGYEQKQKMQYEGSKSVRGLIANVWKRCAEGNNITIRYMLIDETRSGEIFGYGDLAIPLRITVEGTFNETKINQSYEFIHYQKGFTDAETLLAIPFNKGCQRLKEPSKEMDYENSNFVFEAEIVYTVQSETDKHIYINNLKAAYDTRSELIAYTTIPWIAHNDSIIALAGDELFRVFDVKNGYLYEVDLDKSSCDISATTPEESGAVLTLPNGDDFPLLDPNIFILNNDSMAGFKHMGKGKVRGKEVDVFEKKLKDEKAEDEPIVTNITTRYYLAEGQIEKSETTEKNILLKLVYTEYLDGKFTANLVFNLYHYNTKLFHRPKTFDVSSCFREQNQTEWFQVSFPYYYSNVTMEELQNAIPVIQENFMTLLIVEEIVTPVRVPRIMVDVDLSYLYITTALVERVPAKLDFKFEANVRLNPIANAVPQGLKTEEGCFQACIQNKKCKAINYCGVNCVLLNEEYKSAMGTANKECTLYKRVKKNTQLTIEQVNKKLDEKIGVGDFRLVVPGKDHKSYKTLTYPTFRQGVAFGLNNYKGDDTNKKIDRGFSIFKPGYNMKAPDCSATQTFAECQRECLSDPHCESFSFCDVTLSCGFSNFHGEDLGENNLVQDDKCITLTRKYVSSFNQYPGVSMITKAGVQLEIDSPDSCARACINEKKIECRSFDLCSGAPGKTQCLLHSSHLIDTNGEAVKASNCEHYSRIYVLDFKVEKGKSLTNNLVHQRIEDLPSVEECAKLCVENSDCKTFDFCKKPFMKASQCYISTTTPSPNEKRNDPTCSLYSKPDGKTDNLLSPVKIETVEHIGVHYSEKLFADDDGQEKVEIIVDDTGYSKSLTGGIAFFLFLVGIAIGAAAMFGYGYYKANRRV